MVEQPSPHPNETLIRKAFEAFMRGDLVAARAFSTPEWSGTSQVVGRCRETFAGSMRSPAGAAYWFNLSEEPSARIS